MFWWTIRERCHSNRNTNHKMWHKFAVKAKYPLQIFVKKIDFDLCSKDEECLRPGEASDLTFLDKMDKTIGKHAHFVR